MRARLSGSKSMPLSSTAIHLMPFGAKLESGHWDWLGVVERRGRRTFVVGRPAHPSEVGMPGIQQTDPTSGRRYRVETRIPLSTAVGLVAYRTPEEAREA